jgi:hypothetical protein
MRGKVKHVLFDPKNPGHVRDLEELENLAHANIGGLLSDNLLIQYFEGRPVGYTAFELVKKPRIVCINHIYVLPEYRDTQPRPPMTEAEKKKIAERWDSGLKLPPVASGEPIISEQEIIGTIFGKFQGRIRLPKYAERDIRKVQLAKAGLRKREPQLILAGKMMRWLAKRYSAEIETPVIHSPMGEKVMGTYAKKYDLNYFKRTGAKSAKKARP